jgi:hypothetical protein
MILQGRSFRQRVQMDSVGKFLVYFRDRLRHQECVLLSFFCAIIIVSTPVQHYISLSRFQHYSFGLAAISIGFLIQTVVSWRTVSFWGKLTLLSSFLYLGAFAAVFYCNPWLDWNVSLETDSQTEERHKLAAYFAFAGVPLAYIWSRWAIDKYNAAAKASESKLAREDSSLLR